MSGEDVDAEVAALRAEVATLRDHVERFGRELQLLRERGGFSMRGQLRCVVCGCRKIAHATSVLDRGDGDTRETMALYQPSWWSSKVVGELEAYTCTSCGLVEWWVREPGQLKEHADYMRILDGTPPSDGPFR
jgi:hypothetical protein